MKETVKENLLPVQVPGNRPYREYDKIPLIPHATKSCSSCGLCAKECPVNAIPTDNPKVTDKSKIVKKSVFTIYENESTVYAGKVEYKYYLDITYTYNNKNIEYKNIELGIGTVDKAGIAAPNLYIIYTPVLGMYGNENVAKDEITVKYRPDSEKADWEKPVNVYLVEQTANYGSTEDTKVSLNKDNIKIECYNNSSESDKLGFYTNVAGWTGENSSLTEGGSSINKYLER